MSFAAILPSAYSSTPSLHQALRFLHNGCGVVHGDVQPSNLLLAADGSLLLADFGESQVLEGGAAGDDATCRTQGTAAFAAPECVAGRPYRGRPADVWALGVTLFCLAFGYCPFGGRCVEETYEQVRACKFDRFVIDSRLSCPPSSAATAGL